ncbi:hypothetical protein [Hugenholtzia roseola]|uniref:hypothetical protein n=1 Tax=Hugenholtzia roseola TaxID=1002 RepID=UPI000419449F|nr:hypothetical protein [Hugenholtzia roseola]
MRFVSFFLLILLCFLGLEVAQAARLKWYVLVVAATEDTNPNTRAGIGESYAMATQNVRHIATLLDYDLEVFPIVGKDLSKQKVSDTYLHICRKAAALKGKQKTMFHFISITHGLNFEDSKTQLPYLVCFSQNRVMQKTDLLSLEGLVYDAYIGQRFDVLHFWVEACNNQAAGHQKAPAPLFLLSRNPKSEKEKLHQLLVSQPLVVLIAAQYSEFAVVDTQQGGAFACALWKNLSLLSQSDTLAPEWEQFYPLLRQDCNRFAQKIAGVSQTPRLFLSQDFKNYFEK